MNAKVMQHVEEAVDKVRTIFMEAATRIESIKPGDKIPATKLAEELAAKRGKTGPTLYPTLKLLLTNYPGVKILKGAHGGIYKLDDKTTAPVDTKAPDGDNGVVDGVST